MEKRPLGFSVFSVSVVKKLIMSTLCIDICHQGTKTPRKQKTKQFSAVKNLGEFFVPLCLCGQIVLLFRDSELF